MFVNKVLRMSVPKKNEAVGGWSKLHNEGLHNLYSLACIIIMIKLRKMRCTRHIDAWDEECLKEFGRKAREKETTRKTSK
jgi:hypothetical protein